MTVRLHRINNGLFLAERFLPLRYLIPIFFYLFWPLNSLRLALKALTRAGKKVRENFGKPLLEQYREMIRLAWWERIHPGYYYYYRLFQPERWENRKNYLLVSDPAPLFRFLNSSADTALVGDKSRFYTICRQHKIPTPQCIAFMKNGVFLSGGCATLFNNAYDFIVKPNNGSGGEGVFHCRKKGKGYQVGKEEVSTDECLAILSKRSFQTPIIVQERLKNHPDIEMITNGFLAVARVVTYMDKHGKVLVLGTVFQTPFDAMEVSNGGLTFPIDHEHGEILPQITGSLLRGHCVVHPNTGEHIAGRNLPGWSEAIKSVIRGHEQLKDFFSLGWDVAFTPDGPRVLETNINWNFHFIQNVFGLPLGTSDFAKAAFERLAIKEESQTERKR